MANIIDRVRNVLARRAARPAETSAPPDVATAGDDSVSDPHSTAGPVHVASPGAWRSMQPMMLVTRRTTPVVRQREFASSLAIRNPPTTLRSLDHASAATIGGVTTGTAVLRVSGTEPALTGSALPALPAARQSATIDLSEQFAAGGDTHGPDLPIDAETSLVGSSDAAPPTLDRAADLVETRSPSTQVARQVGSTSPSAIGSEATGSIATGPVPLASDVSRRLTTSQAARVQRAASPSVQPLRRSSPSHPPSSVARPSEIEPTGASMLPVRSAADAVPTARNIPTGQSSSSSSPGDPHSADQEGWSEAEPAGTSPGVLSPPVAAAEPSDLGHVTPASTLDTTGARTTSDQAPAVARSTESAGPAAPLQRLPGPIRSAPVPLPLAPSSAGDERASIIGPFGTPADVAGPRAPMEAAREASSDTAADEHVDRRIDIARAVETDEAPSSAGFEIDEASAMPLGASTNVQAATMTPGAVSSPHQPSSFSTHVARSPIAPPTKTPTSSNPFTPPIRPVATDRPRTAPSPAAKEPASPIAGRFGGVDGSFVAELRPIRPLPNAAARVVARSVDGATQKLTPTSEIGIPGHSPADMSDSIADRRGTADFGPVRFEHLVVSRYQRAPESGDEPFANAISAAEESRVGLDPAQDHETGRSPLGRQADTGVARLRAFEHLVVSRQQLGPESGGRPFAQAISAAPDSPVGIDRADDDIGEFSQVQRREGTIGAGEPPSGGDTARSGLAPRAARAAPRSASRTRT
jgi:hypothetical protein